MTEQEKKGRLILLIYIGLILAMSAATIAFNASVVGPERLGQQGFRFILTALLCLFLYNGSKGAKWIAIVLLIPAGALAFFMTFLDSLVAIALGGIMAVLYLSFAWVLLWSPSVNAFLKCQRQQVAAEQNPVFDRPEQEESWPDNRE